MNKKYIAVSIPNNESWLEREYKRVARDVARGDCPECKACGSVVYMPDVNQCGCICCNYHTIAVANTTADGKSDTITKGTPKEKKLPEGREAPGLY